MRKRLLPALVGLLALPTLCEAQQLYRCGNTYSQTPCDANATPARVSAGAAPETPSGSRGKELCLSEGVDRLGFPDPDSTRIKSVAKGGTEVIQYSGQPVVARRYNLILNTKDSNGAYVGERIYPCFLSEDEARVLAVGAQRR